MKHPPQEPDLVPGATIASVALGVIIATIVGILIAYALGSCASREPGSRWMSGNPPPIPPEVNAMETTVFPVEAQGIELHRQSEQLLGTYGWIDRERGIIHVPLEIAFELYLARLRGGQR